MAISEEDIINLIYDHLSGAMEEERKRILMEWVAERAENRIFFEKICTEFESGRRWKLYEGIDTEVAIKKFDSSTFVSSRISHYVGWASIAAVAVVLISVGIFFLFPDRAEQPVMQVAKIGIPPGCSKAILILADGQEVALKGDDSVQVNSVAGFQIVSKDQQLIYNTKSSVPQEYNELRIPRGGEYQVVLSDGTSIRLNSGSSLKYPVIFSGHVREVELTGEGFFEVTRDSVPFQVKVGNMIVKVYGTVFNINAHSPEQIQTALAEGKVGITVAEEKQEYILKPLQLAEYNSRTSEMNICRTDIAPYLAWTNGWFVFDNRSLEDIMKTLSLWYDVDVVFRSQTVRGLHFTGSVKRYEDITTILNALSLSVGVKFSQQGKTLIITN